MILDLGWCQGYKALQFHMEDALIENNLDPNKAVDNPPYALFSKKYYNEIDSLDSNKIYDFCFIGSINSNYDNRKWVIDFVKKYFTDRSIYINTDNEPNYELLGSFDLSLKNLGFCPKNSNYTDVKKAQYRIINENLFYFQTMKQSKFCLCPAGDAPWSFRFYEVLMCKTIPIVYSWHHTYRTEEEAYLNYQYVLYDKIESFLDVYTLHEKDMVDSNTYLFKTHHML